MIQSELNEVRMHRTDIRVQLPMQIEPLILRYRMNKTHICDLYASQRRPIIDLVTMSDRRIADEDMTRETCCILASSICIPK